MNHLGHVKPLDAAMYEGMKRACLQVLPKAASGLTLAEISERLPPHLLEEQFPGGARAGWWAKTVQLYLEAKGPVVQEKCSPIRLRK